MLNLAGVYTAMVTPFRDGKVDYEALAALVEEQIAGGIAGLLQLSEISAGKSYRKAVGRTAVELLDNIGYVGIREKEKIINEINQESEL